MPRKPQNPDYEARAVKSADRVLDIFVLLAHSPQGIKLKDMATQLGVPISSMHAILNTMRQRGFVDRDPGSLRYRLSSKVYQIVPPATPSQSEEDLVSLALPVLDKAQRASQETATLTVRVGDEIVFIGKRSGTSAIQVVNALGSRLPAHSTASGKVMLSYLPEAEIDRIYPDESLPRFTAKTITSRAELKRELGAIRQLGYAFDEEESVTGVWAVAACIHAQDGQPIAGTSIVVPGMRVTEVNKLHWREIILDAAAEITSQLSVVARREALTQAIYR